MTRLRLFLFSLFQSSYNPFPSLLLYTHSLISLIFLRTCIEHILPTLVLCSFMLYTVYSALPSSFNWFPLPPGRHVVQLFIRRSKMAAAMIER
jgi:hypothetical protein